MSGFSNISPAVAAFVGGPFHSNAELTRSLEIRSSYAPHLLTTLSDVLAIAHGAYSVVLDAALAHIRDTVKHCRSPLAAAQNGAYLSDDTELAVVPTKLERLMGYVLARATVASVTLSITTDRLPSRHVTMPRMPSRHVTYAFCLSKTVAGNR